MSFEGARRMLRWREQPQLFVRECLGVTPDAWQDDVLAAFPTNQRLAMKACKGPGKTAVEVWLAWNFLLTRSHPKIAATSITRENLADNLWLRVDARKWLMAKMAPKRYGDKLDVAHSGGLTLE